ncbi:hypothetical protein [Paraburkholderia sp.]|uniref:hypothetical protein n=1 Tax=Paraburkholderia sp. TaxID=1926495 RepID=UPI00238A2856|nr:hypothetical protein [Paraburkholderia sp.]MDE1179830.1 hypothetical protein [Paraburkholderia sp.]
MTVITRGGRHAAIRRQGGATAHAIAACVARTACVVASLAIASSAYAATITPVLPAAPAGGCGMLKGHGATTVPNNAASFREGAFALNDGEAIALYDAHGGRTFGTLALERFGSGYEAFWRPMSSDASYLLMLNGSDSAALTATTTRNRTHWTIPVPVGTVVGPLAITACAGVKTGTR